MPFYKLLTHSLAAALLTATAVTEVQAASIRLEGFETPTLTSAAFPSGLVYLPSSSVPTQGAGAPFWKFSGTTGKGIQKSGGKFPGAAAPEGFQTAFLTGPDAKISQAVKLNSGVYSIQFKAARIAYLSDKANPIQVSVGGKPVGAAVTPQKTSFETYQSGTFTVTSETPVATEIELKSIYFQGDDWKRTSLIDDVRVIYHEPPRVFFTDLDSGPNVGGKDNKGVMLRIYGNNFGATRGNSSVTIGGGQVANYIYWSNDKIVVQLGAAAKTGPVVVTSPSGIASNGVPFVVRPGAIYFVHPSAAVGAPGTFESPMSPSDMYDKMRNNEGVTFYLRGGIYDKLHTGSPSWEANFALGSSVSGKPGYAKAIVGYPLEVPVVKGQTKAFAFADAGSDGNGDYFTISNIHCESNAVCVHAGSSAITLKSGAKGIRVIGNTMSATYGKSNTGTGLISVGNDNWKILGNELKNTGYLGGTVCDSTVLDQNRQNHGIYIQLAASHVEVGWNKLHDLCMGHVIQVHTDTQPSFAGSPYYHENVAIHDNVISARAPDHARGINVGVTRPGSSGKIYNNVIYNAGGDHSAIAVQSGRWDVFGNTMNNIKATQYGEQGVIFVKNDSSSPTSVRIMNNIIFSAFSSPYIVNHGASVTISNNLYFGGTNLPADAARQTSNPLFVDPANGNFRLKAGSPAIDKGSSTVGPVVQQDGDGLRRPQLGGYDIGAYEYMAP